MLCLSTISREIRWFVLCAPLLSVIMAAAVCAEQRTLDPKLHHLRSGTEREWDEFPVEAEGTMLSLTFQAAANAAEHTLRLRQQDVKQVWKVSLNGKPLGQLERDENDMSVYFTVAAGVLRDGDNLLHIESTGNVADDIRVGQIVLDSRPRSVVLSECRVELTVRDADSNTPLPCRITILDANGSLQTLGTASNDTLAVRPGVVYSGNGQAPLELPAGQYTIYAGRGFEYGVDAVELSLQSGDVARMTLSIRREVPTPGWASCDTHVHTLTHSGHGDSTITERMLTLAGEGIELPIATDHNVHIDYEPIARRLGMRQHFTPVIGNEVTTKIGHFNVFPMQAGAPIPDFRLNDWDSIFASIFATPDVKLVILNHARDIHSGYRPFDPLHHNAVVGENLDGWNLQANAMEVINSSAQQTDVMRLLHDWMGMLNRGHILTPVGSSDSHDVARHFVGQARTYIRCRDDDPGNIDVNEAVANFRSGQVSVSLGLLTEIIVNDKYGPGELAAVDGDVNVQVRVLGPAWVAADRVELYANGRKIREAAIDSAQGKQAGVKWTGQWTLTDLKHDVHLVAIARGPGVRALYWPLAKPYQPISPHWAATMVGATGAAWLDVDGDGQRTSAHEYAKRLVTQSDGKLPQLFVVLNNYDEAVAAQAAHLLQQNGVSLLDSAVQTELKQAAIPVQRGFQQYIEAWRQSEQARSGR
jgi:hypothetical protein